TELLLRIAVDAGYCIDKTTLTASAPPSTGTTRAAADTASATPTPGPRCARFLASRAKASVQWKQENAYRTFESTFATRLPKNESRTVNAPVEAAG
ncbi:hypothetical protein ACFVZW_24090, partial [Streptomyces sp. NPDC059567]